MKSIFLPKLALGCLTLTSLLTLSSMAKTQTTLKFGIVPQQAATVLIERWGPLIDELNKTCACKIEFATAPDIPSFEKKVHAAEYDLVYLNPMHFVQSQKFGYSALVKEQGRKLKGLIVVKKESSSKTLSDLTGQKIAFPGPTSFAATVLTQKMFELEGVKIEPVFVKSHDSVYLNILSGLMPAGGGVNRTFDALPAGDKDKLRILATTQEATPHPIAVHSRVDKKIRALLQAELIKLESSPEGHQILEKLELKPLVEAKDSDWDDVKKILKEAKP